MTSTFECKIRVRSSSPYKTGSTLAHLVTSSEFGKMSKALVDDCLSVGWSATSSRVVLRGFCIHSTTCKKKRKEEKKNDGGSRKRGGERQQ